MSRSVSWRRLCTKDVSDRIDESLRSTLYLLNEVGPTGFVVKQDGSDKKFKVFLGDPHSCTCSRFKKEKELCIHILWLLLKKFRVPKDNPVVFQLGLVEREIQEILSGRLKLQSPRGDKQQQQNSADHSGSSCVQRSISTDDICPICQESLAIKLQRLSYCKYGCGNNVHLRCIKMWAEHQKTQGEAVVTCPLCREKFSSFKELYDELHSTTKRLPRIGRDALHLGITCDHCHICPIPGKCYKCNTCLNYFLCSDCFKSNQHKEHTFLFRQHPSHTWRSAAARLSITLPSQNLIDELQNRELSENDYDLLLQLDASPNLSIEGPSSTTTPMVPRHVLSSFHSEPLDHDHWLIVSRRTCSLCLEPYRRGEWVRRFPCRHKFHRHCIDEKLRCDLFGNITCPIDGKVIYTPDQEKRVTQQCGGSAAHKKTQANTTTSQTDQKQQQQNAFMSVKGQGLELGRSRLVDDNDVTTPLAAKPLSTLVPSIRKGLAIVTTPINSGKHHRKTGNELTDGMELSLQAIPISACSNASEQGDQEMNRLFLSNSAKSYVHRSPQMNQTDRMLRRSSKPVISLTAKRKEEKSLTQQEGGLPKIHPLVDCDSLWNSSLSISAVSKHDRLPPIDAHLKHKTDSS